MPRIELMTALTIALVLAGCQGAEIAEPAQSSTSHSTSPDLSPTADDPIGAISKAGDVVLARKDFDLMGVGAPQIVAIIKRAGSDASQTNPCELLVLQKESAGYSPIASNNKVVDCLYNDIAKNAKDLSENLTLGAGSISYNNQGEVARTEYTFHYAKETNDWFLSEAVSYYSGPSPDNTEQYDYKESAKYPGNIPKIPLSQFDPEKILAVMREGREVQ